MDIYYGEKATVITESEHGLDRSYALLWARMELKLWLTMLAAPGMKLTDQRVRSSSSWRNQSRGGEGSGVRFATIEDTTRARIAKGYSEIAT